MLAHRKFRFNSHKHALSRIWIHFVFYFCESRIHTLLLDEAHSTEEWGCGFKVECIWKWCFVGNIQQCLYCHQFRCKTNTHTHNGEFVKMFHWRFITLLTGCHLADEKCNKIWSKCNTSLLCLFHKKQRCVMVSYSCMVLSALSGCILYDVDDCVCCIHKSDRRKR